MVIRVLTAIALLALATPVGAQSDPTLEDLLLRAGSYLDTFVSRFSNVVSEERYYQEATGAVVSVNGVLGRGNITSGSLPRTEKVTLKSDFLLVRVSDYADWIPFRDVFEVNGVTVRDREGRLTKLFTSSSGSALEQAQQITRESARYNIGNMTRTINNPLLSLAFLMRDFRGRFAFTLGRIDKQVGPTAWVVDYKEQVRPTLIRGYGDGDLPARGRAWIEGGTGAVLKTEFFLDDPAVNARVSTTFKSDERLGIHVPNEMIEEYKLAGGARVSGKATYSRFRQFNVKTEEQINKPTDPDRQ